MARKSKRNPDALQTINAVCLEHVIGGRLAIPKGPSPELVQGLQGLVESVGALGQKRQADQAAQGQMMQQMMGMMQQRGGR